MRMLEEIVSDAPVAGDEPAVVVAVHVQPGAGRSALVGRHGAALKVRVAAPPVDGRANEAAAVLLAEVLDVAEAAVELVGGERSRAKRFRVRGLDAGEARVRLEAALRAAEEGPGRSRTHRSR